MQNKYRSDGTYFSFDSKLTRQEKQIMMAFLPLLFGQNPTPENHAKLLFTIGIPTDLRSAYSIKI
jgi:hypothetical protein